MEDKVKLTSVKLLSDLYKTFKRESLITEFTLQKLINRCLDTCQTKILENGYTNMNIYKYRGVNFNDATERKYYKSTHTEI